MHRLDLTVLRCGSCGLCFVGDVFDDAAIDHLYGQEALAAYFVRLGPRHVKKFAPRLHELPALGVGPGARVLDVGCGSGEFSAMAAAAGYDAVGIDISEPSIRAARQLFPSAEYRVATAGSAAAAEPEGYDLVTLWDVIEHVLEPHRVVADCVAALRPGGMLALGTPNGESLYDTMVDIAYRTHTSVADRMLEQRYSDWHLQIWTASTLARLVRDHGLEPLRVLRHRELSAPPSLYVRQSSYARLGAVVRVLDPAIELLWPFRNKLTLYARKP